MATLDSILGQLDDGTFGRENPQAAAPAAAAAFNPGLTDANRGEQATAQAPADPQAPQAAPALPAALQDALRGLVRDYEMESDAVRRWKVQQWREGEEFWRGNQDIWYSARDSRWHTTFEQARADESPAWNRYTVNLYRPWGLSIIAALTQAPPKIQYLPVSADSQDDIATARAATRVAQLVARNNNLATLRVKKGYYLWTQGSFATYIRFLVDGGQFGHHPEPVLAPLRMQVLPDRFECAHCGHYQPAAASPGLLAGNPVACQGCGGLMAPGDFSPAQYVDSVLPTGVRQVPNGAEKLDTYGPLYFKVPPQALTQRDCYYLIQVEEQHKAVLRAAYPSLADQIGDPGAVGEDAYERIVRLSLADAMGTGTAIPAADLVTYKRCWLRPEAFWAHAEPEVRTQLLTLFPDGCRVEFAGDLFLQALPERLDDCWVVCPGQPGIGIYRDPLGWDAIPIQRQINDSANLLAEHRDRASAPPILYDARYIDGAALINKRMEPGSYVPVLFEDKPGSAARSLPEMMFQAHFSVDPELWNDGSRLAEVGQFITGALPSMFGGGVPNLNTAAAYAQSREQAMGRLSLIWKQMREAEAREMTLAVECFRRNRADDVELVVEGATGGFRSEYIRLNELRGNIIARPSADEDFPQSFTQVREALGQIMQSRDPELLDVIGAPVNRPLVQHYLGLPDLVDPGEDNRTKQFIEIEALAASEPVPLAGGGWAPSIAPEAAVDDHAIHIATIREWAVSEIGLQTKASQPLGYANVIAHLLAHQRLLSGNPATPTQKGNPQ